MPFNTSVIIWGILLLISYNVSLGQTSLEHLILKGRLVDKDSTSYGIAHAEIEVPNWDVFYSTSEGKFMITSNSYSPGEDIQLRIIAKGYKHKIINHRISSNPNEEERIIYLEKALKVVPPPIPYSASTKKVRGKVVGKRSKKPLTKIGVELITTPFYGKTAEKLRVSGNLFPITTDENGEFQLEVPIELLNSIEYIQIEFFDKSQNYHNRICKFLKAELLIGQLELVEMEMVHLKREKEFELYRDSTVRKVIFSCEPGDIVSLSVSGGISYKSHDLGANGSQLNPKKFRRIFNSYNFGAILWRIEKGEWNLLSSQEYNMFIPHTSIKYFEFMINIQEKEKMEGGVTIHLVRVK